MASFHSKLLHMLVSLGRVRPGNGPKKKVENLRPFLCDWDFHNGDFTKNGASWRMGWYFMANTELVGGLEHDFFYDFPYIGKNQRKLTFIFFGGAQINNQWRYEYDLSITQCKIC